MQSCERSGVSTAFGRRGGIQKHRSKGRKICPHFAFLRVSVSFHQLSQRLCLHFFFLLLCCAREVLPFKFFHTFQSFSCDILQRETILPCLQGPLPTLPLQPPPPLGQCIDSLQGWQHTHTQHASPLGSGHILPPAVRPRRLTSPSPPLLPQSLLLLISCPHTHRRGGLVGGWVGAGEGGGRVMTEVSAWVTVILSAVVPTGPGKSMHSSPVLRLHQSALLCSQDSHSCPSRAPTVRPSQGSSYTEAVMGKKSV